MQDALDDNATAFHVKENSIVARTQTIIMVKFREPLEVTPQTVLQPVNLAHDLPGYPGRQPFQIRNRRIRVMNFQELKIQ